MATTNEILVEIAAFTAANGRPCPAKHLTEKFGTGVLDQIAALKKEGKVYGRRGRTGGLVSNEPVSQLEADTTPVSITLQNDPAGDLAAEFAALAEKLAEASGESEPVSATG